MEAQTTERRIGEPEVLVFGQGPVRDRFAAGVRRRDRSVLAPGAGGPTRPIQAALVSFESIDGRVCDLALSMFTVVEDIERSCSAFPGPSPRVVVVTPTAGRAKSARHLTRTLALYLGAPERVELNIVEAPASPDSATIQETADLALALLLGAVAASG